MTTLEVLESLTAINEKISYAENAMERLAKHDKIFLVDLNNDNFKVPSEIGSKVTELILAHFTQEKEQLIKKAAKLMKTKTSDPYVRV